MAIVFPGPGTAAGLAFGFAGYLAGAFGMALCD